MSTRSLRSQAALTGSASHIGDTSPIGPSESTASRVVDQALANIAALEARNELSTSGQHEDEQDASDNHPIIVGADDDSASASEEEIAPKKETPPSSEKAPLDPMERLASVFADALVKVSEKSEPITVKTSADFISKGPEARVPDKYDGTKADKLRPFLSGLNIVFLNHEKRFATDRAKVVFAGSFLSGVAADWFEPIINETSKEALMLDNYELFKDRITKVFGDPNAEATAEHNLRLLVMKDSEAIANYITRFRTESARLKWDDSALKYHFRTGLADRILDDLARMTDQPDSLSELMEMSLAIDNRHWERNREKSFRRSAQRETSRPVLGSSLGIGSSSPQNRNSYRRSTPRALAPRPTSSFPERTYDTRFKRGDSRQPPAKSNNLDKVLVGGKLTSDEKQRRLEKGLCNYCGGPHKLENCPAKPDSRSSSGRSSAVARQSKN